MTWKKARKLVEARRERVAAFRLRGLTEREIEAALEQQGFINPETGKPFSHGTIASDMIALHAQWMANAAQDIADLKADQLAELRELRRRNWAKDDLVEVRNCLALEAKILGTPAPQKVQLSGQVDLTKLSDEQLQRLVDGEPVTDVLTD